MRRREFMAVIAGAACACTQSAGLPVVGFLNTQSEDVSVPYKDAFRDGLKQEGYVEGQNVKIEYGWAKGDDQRLKELAAELVNHQVAVIAATGGIRSVQAVQEAQVAQEAKSRIPTLFISGSNPVHLGLVESINRPGRNLTGVSLDTTEMVPKRFEKLKEFLPPGSKMAMLISLESVLGSPRSSVPESERRFAESDGALVLRIHDPQNFDEELEKKLVMARKDGVRGFVVGADPFFTTRLGVIVALAAKHQLAALYPLRPYVVAGGLASYGPSLVDVYRQIGIYAGRILKGAKPEELPVVFPRKWEFVINRKTAQALGLDITWLSAYADEIIK